MSKYFWLCFCIGILICDIALKTYCRQYPHDTYIHGLHIVYNTRDIPLLFIICACILFTFLSITHLNLRWNIIALGGAYSNVIEVIIFDSVTDMIDFKYLIPNIADFMVLAGVIKCLWVFHNMKYQKTILDL